MIIFPGGSLAFFLQRQPHQQPAPKVTVLLTCFICRCSIMKSFTGHDDSLLRKLSWNEKMLPYPADVHNSYFHFSASILPDFDWFTKDRHVTGNLIYCGRKESQTSLDYVQHIHRRGGDDEGRGVLNCGLLLPVPKSTTYRPLGVSLTMLRGAPK